MSHMTDLSDKDLYKNYIELECQSNFSLLEGGSSALELFEEAKKLGYEGLGIADTHTLGGVVRAHAAARKYGMRFFCGTRIFLYETLNTDTPVSIGALAETNPEIMHRKINDESPSSRLIHSTNFLSDCIKESLLLPFSLLLYPSSRISYGEISTLLSTGKMRGDKGECILTINDLHMLTGGTFCGVCIHSFTSPTLLTYLERLKKIFSHDRLSLCLSYTYGPESIKRGERIKIISSLSKIPLLATNAVLFHHPSRKPLTDVLTCIKHHKTLESAGFLIAQNAERHLKSPPEMKRLFKREPEAIRRSLEIASAISTFSLDEIKYEYPDKVCEQGHTAEQSLRIRTEIGLKERYSKHIPPEVRTLIEKELKLIKELGYEKYFLTVDDITRFAKSQGILYQGRGAAANSAVCFALGITAVDPKKINLMLERFISKERDEPPDIDIDFEHERREEVIQYIYQKFGRMHAALTAEVVCYRTKSAVRDIGNVFSLSEHEISILGKAVRRNKDLTQILDYLSKNGISLTKYSFPLIIRLVDELRGFPRHISQHVGGFIISEAPLSNIVPISWARMPGRTLIEWDKDDIETLGILKIDVLGLGMLTMIRKAFEIIRSTEQRELSLYKVPAECPQVYEMISKADTIGIFQVESRAQMSMLPRMKPKTFYDLVIQVAIVRPGPIQGGMVHPYLRRRAGLEPINYPSDKIKSILESTLGVPIFQEQVMQLAVVAAGFTGGEADALRRAMGAWGKDQNRLLAFRSRIKSGMLQRGYSETFADSLFEQMKGFGEYGFPQSHAASFALLVYVSGWLKRHYPAAFYAALLNSQPMGFYQPAQLIADAKRHGILFLSVDINKSKWDSCLEKSPLSEGKYCIRLGLNLVKGVTEHEIDKILERRSIQGEFKSLRNLWIQSGVSKGTLKNLARADALSSLGLERKDALWELSSYKDTPLPLLDKIEEKIGAHSNPVFLPGESALESTLKDYKSLRFSLRAHPLSLLRPMLSRRRYQSTKEILILQNKAWTSVAGLIFVRQQPATASGVVFLSIEDESGNLNLIVKPRVYQLYRDTICDSIFIGAVGRVQQASDVCHLIVEEVIDLGHFLNNDKFEVRDFH